MSFGRGLMPRSVRMWWRFGSRVLLLAVIIASVVGGVGSAAFATNGWSAPYRIDHHMIVRNTSFDLDAVSCASVSFCVAVDNEGRALTYNGSTWSTATRIESPEILESVSCPSATFCVAVDEAGNALTYNGATWSAPVSIAPASTVLASVSCPSSTFCAAVGPYLAVTYNGTNWSSAVTIDTGESNYLTSVSCASGTFCIAVDAEGNAVTYDGTSWSAPANVESSTSGFTSISCPSTAFCDAVDGDGGQVFTYNGTDWSSPVTIDAGHIFVFLSCASASFCAAVDYEGNALTYNGTGWSAPSYIEPPRVVNHELSFSELFSVSCPTSNFCATVTDNSRQVLTYDALAITTTSLPAGAVGRTYSTPLTASGGHTPYSWGIAKGSKLPKGLRLSRVTGVLSGTPRVSGTFAFTVEVMDAKTTTTVPHKHSNDSRVFTITIS
jgi:hypothetical protein